jgi:hypothetical protein
MDFSVHNLSDADTVFSFQFSGMAALPLEVTHLSLWNELCAGKLSKAIGKSPSKCQRLKTENCLSDTSLIFDALHGAH